MSEQFTQEELQQIVSSITMYPVESSNIVAIGYNQELKVLRVIFRGNSSYLYFSVEPEIWSLLSQAESKGRFLTESITKQKDKYKYIKF